MEERNLGGRPTKFTTEYKEKILTAIRKGAPYEIACNYAGLCYDTFRRWRVKSEEEKDPELLAFFAELKEAEGHTALIWLDKIDKAMNEGQWTAASWKLERRHSRYFSHQAAIIEMNERLEKLEKGESREKGKGIQEGRKENDAQDGKED
jgi:hypothetical protein